MSLVGSLVFTSSGKMPAGAKSVGPVGDGFPVGAGQ
jgi:hypothetical protein